MLNSHAYIIKNNITELANSTNILELVPKLISNNVFTQEMINRILSEPGPSQKLQAISLYLSVCKRGPEAFSNLINALMESNHIVQADILRNEDKNLRLNLSHVDSSSSNQPTMAGDQPDHSPESTPTHSCRIPHSGKLLQLPQYLEPALRQAYSGCSHFEEDFYSFGELGVGEVIVKAATEMKGADGRLPEKYRMDCKPRGYVLLINNIRFDDEDDYPTRNGAHNDEKALESLFKQLFFEVEPHTNKTRQEMIQLVEAFAAKTDWHTKNCAFIILMSHGKEGDSEEDTEIIGTDGLGFKTRDIISYFYNDSCPLLVNKPKVFIFQSCRGSLSDHGVEIDLMNVPPYSYLHRTETDGLRKNPRIRDRQRSDIFIAHPVPPGIKANRDRYAGAWFIQTIVQVFSEYSWEIDLEDMFKIVDNRIKRMINSGDPNFQTVTTKTIGWSKKLYFNPGMFYENGRLIKSAVSEEQGMDVVDTPAECQMNGKKEDRLLLTKEETDDEGCVVPGCFKCMPS